MKVLLINGSPHKQGCTYTALAEAARALEHMGIETEIYQLGAGPVQPCNGCGGCRKLGKCVFDDGVNEIAARADSFDGLIVGAPVYYGGPCGQIQCFLDRLFYSAAGRLAGKPAAAVVSCRRGGASAAFQRLNMYFQMCNMPVVSSQYWNQVHGNTPQEVEQDLEGLQTMRTLAQNMAFLLKCRAGSGEALPVYEPKIATNFIR